MGPFTPRARLRAILIAGALAAALAVPVAVSADTTPATIAPAESRGATIVINPAAHLTLKLVATVEVSFTCDPFLVYDWETGTTVPSTSGHLEFGSVVIVQAAGRSVLTSSSDLGSSDVVCDSTTVNTRSAAIVASTQPWKTGAAIVGATIYVIDDEFQQSHYASSGPIAVKLVK